MFAKPPLPRPPRIHGLTINRLIPNIITLLALSAGLTAIRFAMYGQWKPAVIAILLAGVLDGLDGRVARLLQGTSKFGAELDSLSDFVSFGVAPALLIYQWGLRDMGAVGWAVALLFAVCSSLRLARFNTMIGEETPSYAGHFFVGTPAPAAAGLAILPVILSFETGATLLIHPWAVAVLLLFVSMLMVSQIPTFSFKKTRVPRAWVLPLLLVVGLLAAFLVFEPWWSLTIIGVLYLCSIPFSLHSHSRLKRMMVADAPQTADADSENNGSEV